MREDIQCGELSAAALHVVEFLGEALARMLATQAMEEHGVLQYGAALKFVNQAVESRSPMCKTTSVTHGILVTTEDAVLQSVDLDHDNEEELAALSNYTDLILAEAKLLRTKSSARKGLASMSESTVRSGGYIEKKMTPYHELLHGRRMQAKTQSKEVAVSEGCDRQSLASSICLLATQNQPGYRPPQPEVKVKETSRTDNGLTFPSKFRKLVTWLETKISNADVTIVQGGSKKACLPMECHQRLVKTRFLSSLWHLGSIPTDVLPKAVSESTEPSDVESTGTVANIRNLQKFMKGLAQYTESSHMKCLLRVAPGGMVVERRNACVQALLPHFKSQQGACVAIHETDQQHFNDSWLPDDCWSFLGEIVKVSKVGIPTEPAPANQETATTFYSKIEQAVAIAKLMHSIHMTLFRCHLETMVASCLIPNADTRRDILSNPMDLFWCRLVHCILCKEGKGLFALARRTDGPA